MEKSAVTCVCWVPRGRCRGRLAMDSDEDNEKEAETGGGSASSAAIAPTAGLEEFNLDNYDDEDDDAGMQFFTVLNADGELAREKDPYMTGNPDSDSDSEGECEINDKDHVFIPTSCEEDCCTLEVYVFDEEEVNMFVHHDITLGAYPLCVEWIGRTSSSQDGSFAAVGSIDHSIQIWNLEVADPLEPVQVLGQAKKSKSAKGKTRRKKKTSGDEPKAHDGPVLCIHGSPFNRNAIASGAGDHTLKVWDVTDGSCVHSYSHHSDKVQCVRWHPTEQAVMLSAAFDRHLGLLDVRQPGQAVMVQLPAEAECAIWSRHKPFECLASVDSGGVVCYDVRKAAAKAVKEQVLWTLMAHDVACTTVQDVPAPNCLVTAGLDGYAKVWDTSGAGPRMVLSKNLQAGPLFTSQSNPDMPGMLSFGGRCPVLWDLSSEHLLLDVFQLEQAQTDS
jgi:periodic tryptophan protein 1